MLPDQFCFLHSKQGPYSTSQCTLRTHWQYPEWPEHCIQPFHSQLSANLMTPQPTHLCHLTSCKRSLCPNKAKKQVSTNHWWQIILRRVLLVGCPASEQTAFLSLCSPQCLSAPGSRHLQYCPGTQAATFSLLLQGNGKSPVHCCCHRRYLINISWANDSLQGPGNLHLPKLSFAFNASPLLCMRSEGPSELGLFLKQKLQNSWCHLTIKGKDWHHHQTQFNIYTTAWLQSQGPVSRNLTWKSFTQYLKFSTNIDY